MGQPLDGPCDGSIGTAPWLPQHLGKTAESGLRWGLRLALACLGCMRRMPLLTMIDMGAWRQGVHHAGGVRVAPLPMHKLRRYVYVTLPCRLDPMPIQHSLLAFLDCLQVPLPGGSSEAASSGSGHSQLHGSVQHASMGGAIGMGFLSPGAQATPAPGSGRSPPAALQPPATPAGATRGASQVQPGAASQAAGLAAGSGMASAVPGTQPTTALSSWLVSLATEGVGTWGLYEIHRRALQLLASLLERGEEGLLAAMCGADWLYRMPGLGQRLLGIANMAVTIEGGWAVTTLAVTHTHLHG